MFCYKNFIKSYLTGTKTHQKKKFSKEFSQIRRSSQGTQIKYNNTDFSDSPKAQENFVHSPKVPQLPFLSTPRKRVSPKRSQSISNEDDKVKLMRSSVPSKLNTYCINIFNEDLQPVFSSAGSTRLRVSSLNTRYQSNERYIMKNLEKAKKYFPIPLGRKQLRTSSLSISHTPMSRLYSPQNFVARKKNVQQSPKTNDEKEFKEEITVMGRSAVKRKNFKHNQQSHYHDLYAHMIKFFSQVDIFKKRFEDFDKANKGYLVVEDFRSITENSDISAERLFKLFSVSNRNKISKLDFLAICSIFEHNCPESPKQFKFNDRKVIESLEKQVKELKEIFEIHAKNYVISKEYILEISKFLNPNDDVLKTESLVLTSIIDFSWFLRCLPYFLYIHLELLNKPF